MNQTTSLLMIASLCLCPSDRTVAETIRLTSEQDWFSVLSGDSLKPGDEVILAPGTYTDGRRLVISHRGTAEQPIIIRGAAGKSDDAGEPVAAVFRRPDANQNSIHLDGCQHLVLRDLEITGGAAGIRIGGKDSWPARFVTLENLHIHHVGGVAVTANYPGHVYESLMLRGNHIHHTSGHGEGFYLGCNNKADGSTDGHVFHSIIENNYIHHLNGSDVSQGDGIELKDGSYGNIVRDNVIHDTNYPGILVYGTDGHAPNVIEHNVIWNTNDHGIQAASEAIVRHNTIRETKGAGIYCNDHQSARGGNLIITNNTILSKTSIRIAASEPFSGPITIEGNRVSGVLRVPNADRVQWLNTTIEQSAK